MFELIVETGVGVPNANSFASVDEADAVIAVVPGDRAGVWSALSEDSKAKLLVHATSFLCDRVSFKARPILDSSRQRISPLPFPMRPIELEDRCMGSTEIRPKLVRATALAALWFQVEDPDTNDDGFSIKRIRIEPMEIEYRDFARPDTVPDEVLFAIRDIGFLRGRGPRFGRISRS